MTDFHTAPDSWLRKQLKWAVTFQRGHDLPDDAREEGPVPVYAGGGITGWHKEACALPPGIVTGRYGTIGEFHLVSTPYWPLNTALYSIDLHDNDPEYLHYLLEFLAPLFHVHAGKSAVPGVDRNDIHAIPVALPGREQQQRIAAFLGREARRIDGLLTAKQRVLELLTEKRKAIIATAVTRGLDPKVKLRESGVPWLGKLPVHWRALPVKFGFSRIGSGTTPSSGDAQYYGGGVPWITTSELRENNIYESSQSVTQLAVNEHSALKLYPPGTVLFAMYGATIGRVALLRIHATVNQAVCALAEAIEWAPEFVFFSLQASREYLVAEASGGGQPNLNAEKVRNHTIPCPPLDEQRAIVKHVAHDTAKLDAVCAATGRTIALLRERRSALIASAVTGQLGVVAEA